MLRIILVLSAVVAGVIAIGVTAAWQFAEDDPTRRIAIYAAVVATLGSIATAVKNGHDVWDKIQEKKKKADESAERIKAIPLFKIQMTAEPVVSVEVFNGGKVALNLRRVSLACRTEEGEHLVQLTSFGPEVTRHRMDGAPYVTDSFLSQKKLEPTEHAEFFVQVSQPKGFRANELLAMSPDNLWIQVETFTGTVVKVPGAEIQAAIRGTPKRPKLEISTG